MNEFIQHSFIKHISFFLINLFIYFWLCWVFIPACVGFLQLWRAGATLRCGVRASHCGGFSCCRARALGAWASVVVACRLSRCGSRALEHRLSNCGTRAQLLCGMWDLPGPGLEPMSPALAGGFLTTAPPGKSLKHICFDGHCSSTEDKGTKNNKILPSQDLQSSRNRQ